MAKPSESPKGATVIFKETVLHDKHRFAPTIPIAFADPGAADYFVKLGWADYSDKKAVQTFDEGLIEIDPETIQNATGLKVADIHAQAQG